MTIREEKDLLYHRLLTAIDTDERIAIFESIASLNRQLEQANKTINVKEEIKNAKS